MTAAVMFSILFPIGLLAVVMAPRYFWVAMTFATVGMVLLISRLWWGPPMTQRENIEFVLGAVALGCMPLVVRLIILSKELSRRGTIVGVGAFIIMVGCVIVLLVVGSTIPLK